MYPTLPDTLFLNNAIKTTLNGEYVCTNFSNLGYEFQKRTFVTSSNSFVLQNCYIAKRFQGMQLNWYIFEGDDFYYQGQLLLEINIEQTQSPQEYPPTTQDYVLNHLAGWICMRPNDNNNPDMELEVIRVVGA